MVIRCVVFVSTVVDTVWDEHLGCYTESPYTGEERWEVGEPYQGYGIRGEMIRISVETDKSYTLTVRDEKNRAVDVMHIPYHNIRRVYFGE